MFLFVILSFGILTSLRLNDVIKQYFILITNIQQQQTTTDEKIYLLRPIKLLPLIKDVQYSNSFVDKNSHFIILLTASSIILMNTYKIYNFNFLLRYIFLDIYFR